MVKRKYTPISIHQTLPGQLEVNWQQEYNDEFLCPFCNVGRLTWFSHSEGSTCKMILLCNHCKTQNGKSPKSVSLTCRVAAYIFNYRPDRECPNSLCTRLGHNGQKGWIYEIGGNGSDSQCYFCGVRFKYRNLLNKSGRTRRKKRERTDQLVVIGE